MCKTIRTLAALMLTTAFLLSACTAARTKTTDVPAWTGLTEAQTETTESDTQEHTWMLFSDTTAEPEDDWAWPQERPESTTEEENTEEETTTRPTTAAPATTAAATSSTVATIATTTTTTAVSTTVTTTAVTTAPTTKAKPATTAATTVTAKTSASTSATAVSTASQKAQAAPVSAQDAINRASLHPQKTNDAQLDKAVQNVLSRIIKPGMSTYDKILACYDYIILHSEYGRPAMPVTQDDLNAYEQEQDAWIVLFAKRILQNGQGVCDDYAALFLVMTRAIGLDCYYTHGYTTNTKGETKDHVWDTITVNGVDYIFDAQVEDKQSANGIRYTFFCKTYDSSIAKIYSGYDLKSDKQKYNAFRRKNG